MDSLPRKRFTARTACRVSLGDDAQDALAFLPACDYATLHAKTRVRPIAHAPPVRLREVRERRLPSVSSQPSARASRRDCFAKVVATVLRRRAEPLRDGG